MMIVMKDCPNCGSFDITDRQHHVWDDDYLCHACGATWQEGETPNGASVVALDGRDDGSDYYEPLTQDDDDTLLGVDGWPIDMPNDVKAWLADNR